MLVAKFGHMFTYDRHLIWKQLVDFPEHLNRGLAEFGRSRPQRSAGKPIELSLLESVHMNAPSAANLWQDRSRPRG